MASDTLPVLVVIGGGGIGLATAHRLGAGRHILLASRSAPTLSAGAESLEGAGHTVTTRQVDVSSYDSVAGLARAAAGLGGAIEAVVLTSAVSPTTASAEAVLAVDLLGTANVIEAFAAEVEMPPGSSVVCIGSMAVYMVPPFSESLEAHLATAPLSSLLSSGELRDLVGGAGGMAYCVAKKANALRVEAAAASERFAGRGVRVNCVSPGPTQSNMLEKEMEGASGDGVRAMLKANPMKRAATAEEVAQAVAFVVECGYVNGVNLLIDGGWVAARKWGAKVNGGKAADGN
ncbi:hypothetical protein EsH8_VI_000187 [Colletotrichum jinshuiense]